MGYVAVVGGMIDSGVGEILRAALETVLADDDGTLLTLADAFGDE